MTSMDTGYYGTFSFGNWLNFRTSQTILGGCLEKRKLEYTEAWKGIKTKLGKLENLEMVEIQIAHDICL